MMQLYYLHCPGAYPAFLVCVTVLSMVFTAVFTYKRETGAAYSELC